MHAEAEARTSQSAVKRPREVSSYQRGQWDAARSDILDSKGLALLQLGRCREAKEVFKQAEKLFEGDPQAIFLGTLAQQGLGEMTADQASEAAKLGSDDNASQKVALDSIDYSDALRVLLSARPQNPDPAE